MTMKPWLLVLRESLLVGSRGALLLCLQTPFTGHSLPRLTGETKQSVRFCMAIIKPLLWPQCINFICINGGYANIPHCEVLSYYFPCFLVLPTFPLKFSLLHLCLPLRFLPASPLNHFVTLDILPSCLNIIYI